MTDGVLMIADVRGVWKVVVDTRKGKRSFHRHGKTDDLPA